MRTVVIGATGHIGTYLVPRLLAMGHEVVAVSRGQREPYHGATGWGGVTRKTVDRRALEAEGTFGGQIAALEPDIVVDLICFTEESAAHLVQALEGKVRHFLHCGTIWVHGPAEVVPTEETAPRRPFGDYGIRKAAIEAMLMTKAQRDGFPATVVHPGHIVGPGWPPINPAGHLDLEVFERLAAGQELALPERGLGCLHHVHADDVAQVFERAIARWSASVGEAFHAVSPGAVTLQGYAGAVASWFGQEANLAFLPWAKWCATVSEEAVRLTEDHIAHSPNASIAKARALLGYEPRYTSLQAIREALAWLIRAGKVKAPDIDQG